MSTFVFVHGGWHGAWAWYKVVPLLESTGHDVVTLDLPAHGTDTTPIKEVTLEDHVERVVEVLMAGDHWYLKNRRRLLNCGRSIGHHPDRLTTEFC